LVCRTNFIRVFALKYIIYLTKRHCSFITIVQRSLLIIYMQQKQIDIFLVVCHICINRLQNWRNRCIHLRQCQQR